MKVSTRPPKVPSRALFVRLTFVAALSLVAVSSRAEGPALAGIDRFYERAQDLTDAARVEGGDLLVQELNCVACHAAEGEYGKSLNPRTAPNLAEVGARVRPEWLREYLAAPHSAKPGAVMPDLFAGVDDATKREEVESLVHYLANTGSLGQGSPIPSGIARGEQTFHRVGCVACHDPMNVEKKLPHSVPLPTPLSAKYTIPSLTAFLKNPHAARPSGRMPSLNLNDGEAADLASYLLRDLPVAANLTVEIFKGSFSDLASLRNAKPESSVPAFGFQLDIAGANDNFGLRFDGRINVGKAGKYEFTTASDDGSAIWVDGKEVVAVDGIHPKSQKKGSIELEAGVHSLVVEYFEGGGEQELELKVKGPGLSDVSLDTILYVEPKAVEAVSPPPEFVLNPALVERGAEVFAKRNCVACHAMKDSAGEAIKSTPARKLFDLNATAGCLAPEPEPGVPHYDLRPAQRELISAALSTAKNRADAAPTGEDVVRRKFVSLNCYACHQRGTTGGVETDRLEFFITDQPEMGDEGRVPPVLTGTGDKLRPEWLKEVLDKGSKERPYMMTRMPKFGGAALGDLAATLSSLDRQTLLEPPKIDLQAGQITSIGRNLVGGKALSCIKCHTFADRKATGIQAISLTSMHKRLNRDWFERYLLDPQKYRPGTRMPAPWPNGQSFYPDLLDGDPRKQIEAVWNYLSYGPAASIPLGLDMDAIELTPAKRPIIYRNFIEGAGNRAIGVGYPEHANVAFDADEMTLRLIWQNAFIDASKHWNNRGQGFQGPLGDGVLKFDAGVPVAKLDDPNAPWPKDPAKSLGWKFQGYRLDEDGRPKFFYRSPTTSFVDFPQPESGTYPTLRRTIEIDNSAPAGELSYRALRAPKIEKLADGSYRVDEAWTFDLGAASPVLRESDGQKELLVPLPAGKSKIEMHYRW